ncbi:hypothetical protein K438DRAFT_1786394 [Mycena galopus ATCC 62051]|nr:hypothetical protein K438DRAFT_1786394 [Mycena galopus ATCC 62051]
MPGGRKPLDAETKRQHRALSSALYEAKNVNERREAAKLRMRRHREAMANADYHAQRKYRAQVAKHSENYRHRKQQEDLVDRGRAGTIKQRARKLEAENLRATYKPAPTPSRTPRPKPSRKPVAGALPRASFSQISCRPSPLPKPHGTSDEGGGEGRDPSPESDTPCRQPDKPFFPALIRPRTVVGRPCAACGFAGEQTVRGVPVCANIPRLWWSMAAMFPENTSYLLHCNPMKSEFGLASPLSQFLRHINVMISRLFRAVMSLQKFPPSPGLLLCKPIYTPDAGHEDRFTHKAFFAVIHEDWRGVVTSDTTMARMLNAYPKARSFHANTWSRFDKLWTEDCKEWHEHPDAVPVPATKMPSPCKKGELPTEDALKRELIVKQNLRRNLTLTRPPPVPIDAARADAMFTSVLGPEAAASSLPDLASRIAVPTSRPEQGASLSELAEGFARRPGAAAVPISRRDRLAVVMALANESPSTARADAIALIAESTPRISADAELPERDWANARASPPVLYAVSGYNRLFHSRERAVTVLKATPGGVLAFGSDEDELLRFLKEVDNELPALAEVDDDMPALASE